MEKIRLQKFMADCGVASRRKCENLIDTGKVKINGRPARIGAKVDPVHDAVFVGGKKIVRPKQSQLLYIMLHKPRGFVSTMNDEMGRRCVAQLVENVGARVYPVGRLDRDSEGLLLFTNDGEFANAMTHPKHTVSKTYRVTVRPSVNDEQLAAFANGIVIDGKKTAPAEVTILHIEDGRVVLQIILREGRNRQIRKMCEALGLEVARLKRTAIGSVKLGMLKQGDWRFLTEQEIHKLKVNS